jgi:hypothetical protein
MGGRIAISIIFTFAISSHLCKIHIPLLFIIQKRRRRRRICVGENMNNKRIVNKGGMM